MTVAAHQRTTRAKAVPAARTAPAAEADRERRRRREELLRQRAAERSWRERLLSRRIAYTRARRDWVRHLLER